MQKNLLTLKILFFTALIFSASISQSHANPFKEFLDDAERRFDAAPSRVAQFEIVSEPVNRETLARLKSFDEYDKEALTSGVGPGAFLYTDDENKERFNTAKTNALMIAIAFGDIRRVKKFLPVIDDVNAPLLTAWGYRQPYTVAHMALDPRFPESTSKVPLINRLQILDLLGEAGANFNINLVSRYVGVYMNPPLVAAGLNSRHAYTDPLRARALLYGADPVVKGSSGSLVCINPTSECPLDTFLSEAHRLCEIAFKDFYTLSAKGIRLTLAESVKDIFKPSAEELKRSSRDYYNDLEQIIPESMRKIYQAQAQRRLGNLSKISF